METYLLILFRIITIMTLLLLATLFIMGKRPIGELPVFDFLSIIVIGAIVGADIADPKIKHLPTAFAVIATALLQRLISWVSIRNKRFRRFVNFEPTIVIQDGKVIKKALAKIHYSIDELTMLLREKDIFNIGQVSYGVIEPNGNISVLKKADHLEVTRMDMNLLTPNDGMYLTIVMEGKILEKNLKRLNSTETNVLNKIKMNGLESIKDVFYASMDKQGNINISPYDFEGL